MLFVGSVLLSRSLLPSVVLGKEGIGVGGRVVNLGKAESVGVPARRRLRHLLYICPRPWRSERVLLGAMYSSRNLLTRWLCD